MHTPGPWTVRRWGSNDDAWPTNRVSISAGNRAVVISPKYADVDDEANYRLIAAAPEMLEALEATLDWKEVNSKGEYRAAVERAHAAIAKARGES